jgi:NitT/TauT family transport system substrate-binding protein
MTGEGAPERTDTMRGWRTLAMVLGVVALVAAAGQARPAAAAETVKLNLNFLPYGLHAGFFAAREQGWYREAGMEVEILKGEGSSDAVLRMGTGVVDFAFADLGSLILGRSRGLKVKALGIVLDKDPTVMISLKSAGIKTPKDLEGKSVGAMTASGPRELFLPLAEVNKLDPKKVAWVDMPSNAYVPSLMSKKVHAISTYVTTLPTFQIQAKRIGEEPSVLYYADYGVDTYGVGLLTSERMIREKPEMVRRFVEASMRGYAWAFENPEEAIRLFLKAQPEASPERVRSEIRITADLMLTPFAAKEGIGHYDEQKVLRTRDFSLKPRNIDPATMPAKDIYTNEFLPRLFPKRGNL